MRAQLLDQRVRRGPATVVAAIAQRREFPRQPREQPVLECLPMQCYRRFRWQVRCRVLGWLVGLPSSSGREWARSFSPGQRSAPLNSNKPLSLISQGSSLRTLPLKPLRSGFPLSLRCREVLCFFGLRGVCLVASGSYSGVSLPRLGRSRFGANPQASSAGRIG